MQHLFEPFLIKIDKITIQETLKKRSRKNMEVDAKGVQTWSQNRCQNSSKINAQTGNENNYENHQKSCFPEW